MFRAARIPLCSVSPTQGWGSVKLPYVASEKTLLQQLCSLIRWQGPTLPGIVAAGPERPCFTRFCSLGIISGWPRQELDLTCQAKIQSVLNSRGSLGGFSEYSQFSRAKCVELFCFVKYEGTLNAEKQILVENSVKILMCVKEKRLKVFK